jgi:hypothetical protein
MEIVQLARPQPPFESVVVEVAARQRCVLVQRTIHKNLHFKNSTTRLFRQLAMAPGVNL